jgi:hypothetical protein
MAIHNLVNESQRSNRLLRSFSWNATFVVVITPETGAQVRQEFPLISISDVSQWGRIRQAGKVYKYKLKLTKMMYKFLEVLSTFHVYSYYYKDNAKMFALVRFSDLSLTFIDFLFTERKVP